MDELWAAPASEPVSSERPAPAPRPGRRAGGGAALLVGLVGLGELAVGVEPGLWSALGFVVGAVAELVGLAWLGARL